ncbi:MAG TPA: cupin domain-containing protein, partial [Vicinamibacterales bacterium]|nr:cupin domain-containing protein [Vicinamibacterales bacterium]
MQNRRTFLGIAAASLLPVGSDAQTSAPRAPVAELARHALTGPLEAFEVVLVELNIPPGARSPGPGHRHPGPVLGYIVEGQMRFAINNEPEQVLPVGSTFFEPSGAVHTTSGSAR